MLASEAAMSQHAAISQQQQRWEAYKKVMRIFMSGAYDMVSRMSCASGWAVPAVACSATQVSGMDSWPRPNWAPCSCVSRRPATQPHAGFVLTPLCLARSLMPCLSLTCP